MGWDVPDDETVFPPPVEDEQSLALQVDWTHEEEAKAKRK
jgi:hypothetical protein